MIGRTVEIVIRFRHTAVQQVLLKKVEKHSDRESKYTFLQRCSTRTNSKLQKETCFFLPVANLVGLRQKLNHVVYGASLDRAGGEQTQSLTSSGRKTTQVNLKHV